MLLIALLGCDRELATLDSPKATWTHRKEFHGGGRLGGISQWGGLEVEDYPEHRTACYGQPAELEGGEGWVAYRCGGDWYPVHLGPSLLLEDCGNRTPPAPLEDRWLQVLGCQHNTPSQVLEQATEAGVLDGLMLGSLDLELKTWNGEDAWMKAWEALPPEQQVTLEPHLRQAFEQPTSAPRLLRALTLLEHDTAPEELVQRARELIPEQGAPRDLALEMLLRQSRGAPGNADVACGMLQDGATPEEWLAMNLVAEARLPCAIPPMPVCTPDLGCDGRLCSPDELVARVTLVLDGEREGSLEEAWFAHAAATGVLDPTVERQAQRLLYDRVPTEPRCDLVEAPGLACNCFHHPGLIEDAICSMDGGRALTADCILVADDAKGTVTGWQVCTEARQWTGATGAGACCEGLTRNDGGYCLTSLPVFRERVATLRPLAPPNPEALAALQAEVPLPEDLRVLLETADGVYFGEARIHGAERILADTRARGVLTIGTYQELPITWPAWGVVLEKPEGPHSLGLALAEALEELGAW